MQQNKLFPVIYVGLFLLIFVQVDCKKTVTIGGIFHNDDPASQMAFKYAIEKNNQRSGINFVPIIHLVSSTDSYSAGKKACNCTKEGVVAIFGPASQETRGIVESICNTLRIPNFQTFSPIDLPQDFTDVTMSLNFFPPRDILENALIDLVADSGWEGFTILYDDNDGLGRVRKLIENQSSSRIAVRELIKDADNKPIFKELAEADETRIILDCSKDRILEYFRQAKDVGLLQPHQSYILTSLDAHTVDYGEFIEISNISALRVAYEVPQFRQTNININNEQSFYDPSPDTVTLNTALIIDAVNHLSESLSTLLTSTGKVPETKSISCLEANNTFWNQGKAVHHYITEATTIGMTGEIAFKNSQRESVKLEIVELSNSGVNKIGDWNMDTGISHFVDAANTVNRQYDQKEFVVSAIINAPYLKLKIPEDGEVLEGNDRYEGFSVDLMESIASILNISYTFKLAEDNKYGVYDKITKSWNGIIGELKNRRADVGIGDITITSERMQYVDFTVPFMQIGIAVLHVRPSVQYSYFFSFLRPFSLVLWAYIGAAYIAVSIIMYILSRISSNDQRKPETKAQNSKRNPVSPNLIDCWWTPMANILQRGGDIKSRKLSSRIVVGVWWFFILFMVSSYTASLTVFRLNEQYQQSELDIEDLGKQNKIKYGALEGGSTLEYFKKSDVPEYRRIWEVMNSNGIPSAKNSMEGVYRVKSSKGGYAFFMESSTLDYAVARDCELRQLGRTIGHRGFGIVMPLNAFYRTMFNEAIFKLKENGKLQLLKRKWWNEKDGGDVCFGDNANLYFSGDDDFSHLKGIFVVLMFGLTVTFLVAIAEFIWHINKVARREKISAKDAFWKEWGIASRIWTNQRPARHVPSRDDIETTRKDLPLC